MEDILELPPDFAPREQWPEFSLASIPPPQLNPQEVGTAPKGLRWGIWPLYFESYTSDTEPDLAKSDARGDAPSRIIIWHRITRTDAPHGWRAFSQRGSRTESYAELVPGEDYAHAWSESARRYRNKWRREYLGVKYSIEALAYEQFKVAYMQSPTFKKTGEKPLDILRRNIRGRAPSRIWGVLHLESGELAAGMAVMDSPAEHASYYACGFIRQEWSADPLMTGLMEHWFSESARTDIQLLHLGEFWQEGKPADWKGFSQFKSGFGARLIPYPPALVRFAFRKPRVLRWFFERRLIRSRMNGLIDARRVFGQWQVWVNGCQQTGGYVHAMWKDALSRIRTLRPAAATSRNILMLGLGGGGEIQQIYRHFPACRISAVEHDKEMISLAEELALWRPFPPPRIIADDAAEALASLEERFDLIIVDIFRGPEPSPLLQDERFLKALRAHLSDSGIVLANVYEKGEYLDTLQKFFGNGTAWTFRLNRLGLFSKSKKQ